MKLTDDDFLRLVTYMKQNYGINLAKKRVLIEGRLSNMVAEMGYSDFKSYIDFALNDRTGAETIKLVNKLTTNHTFFLREPAHFDFLKETVLPYLESTVKDRDLRIWCAASSRYDHRRVFRLTKGYVGLPHSRHRPGHRRAEDGKGGHLQLRTAERCPR